MEKDNNKTREFWQSLEVCFDKLDPISSREDSLKEIETRMSTCNPLFFSDDEKNIFLENFVKKLCSILTDSSEKCREISMKILLSLCNHLSAVNKIELCISYVCTTLVSRLGRTDKREPSEEVRFLQVQLLHSVIENYNGDLLQYFNNISSILCMCVTDNYPEVKRKSCECIVSLCRNQQKNLHMISSVLLRPLFDTITSQHFKTRTICVKAIGAVVLSNGSSQDFIDAVPHLAQRLFDHSPIVRLVVTDVIGELLLNLNDRYSFFNRLIPLMLSVLFDDIVDIRRKAEVLWNKAGEQYLEENENDYKDLVQFPRPDPEHYPTSEKRPSLGCRILVQRNIHNIIPALVRDIKDWDPSTRLKSVQVLYSLILHSEDKATINLHSFIEGTVLSVKDDSKDVVKYGIKCAEMLGFFLDPNILCDSVMTLVHQSPSAVHLSIFAAVLRGNKKGLPLKCFQAIGKLLSDPAFCRLREAEQQANLLLCIDGIILSGNKIEYVTSHQIFTILCSISGLTANNSIVDKVEELLKELAFQQKYTIEELFKIHCVPLLKTLIVSSELWIPEDPELPIFYFLVQSEYSCKEVVQLALPVMTVNLNLKKDIKLRSKIFTLLIKVFQRLPANEDKEINEKVLNLIQLGVFPNLTWSPGKAASSLRTIAAASLYEVVRKDCIDKAMLKLIANDLLPLLATLSNDDEVSSRLLSCKILEILLHSLHGCIDDYKIHSVCHDFLQCMDDSSDDIRIVTTRVLRAYIKAFPKDYAWSSCRSYLKEMFQTVIIHMDDKNEKIRQNVLSLLKDVAFVDPKLLLNEIEDKRYLMAAGDYCETLIDHIKKLHV